MRPLAIGMVSGVMAVGLLGPCGVHAEEPVPTLPEAHTTPEGSAGSTVPTVQDNMDVSMEYTLLSNGVLIDSSEGREPFHYVQGRHQIIPGLERQLAGMHVGQSRDVLVKPEEGYGPVDSTAFVEVPKERLPKDAPVVVGTRLRGVNPDGQSFQAVIWQAIDNTVILDLNHPLAGKTLTFKVKITGVTPAAGQ